MPAPSMLRHLFARRSWLGACLLVAVWPVLARPHDAPRDDTFPPAQYELTIASHGSRLNGFLYGAAGAGAHPLVIFLHGYPGNERNLDLAQAVRRAGWNALYFDYRGSWGSGGTFSFGHALDDVAAALAFARDPANATKYRIDTRHIVLVGHSLGGGLALLATARDPAVTCAATLAAWNLGGEPALWKADPDRRRKQLDYFQATTDPASGPLKGRADDLRDELLAHASAWDIVAHAPELAHRRLLIVADTRTPVDMQTFRAFTDALRKDAAAHLTALTYDDDHPFSAHRLELAGALVTWLESQCR